jgi:hypothetical protein
MDDKPSMPRRMSTGATASQIRPGFAISPDTLTTHPARQPTPLSATLTGGLSHGAGQFAPLLLLQPGQELAQVMVPIAHRCETQTTALKRSCGSTRVADKSPLAVGWHFATALCDVASV